MPRGTAKTSGSGEVKKPKAPKKDKIVINEEIPVLSEYIQLNDRYKYLDAYTSEVRGLLDQLYNEPDAKGNVNVVYQGNGTELCPTIYMTKKTLTSCVMPRTVSPAMEEFLRENNAEHLISHSAPSTSLFVRNPNGVSEKIKDEAHRVFMEKYHKFTELDDVSRAALQQSIGEMLIRDYWLGKKELKSIKDRLSVLKPIIQKELANIDTTTYVYAFGGGALFSVQHRAGGGKTIDRRSFVELFGTEYLPTFGTEKTTTFFRVESEAEREKRLDFLEKRMEHKRLQSETSLEDDDEYGAPGAGLDFDI